MEEYIMARQGGVEGSSATNTLRTASRKKRQILKAFGHLGMLKKRMILFPMLT